MDVSRRKATVAGNALRDCSPESQEYQNALAVMLQWREQHIVPTQESFRRLLKISKEFPGSVATYRLKRQPSILSKRSICSGVVALRLAHDDGCCDDHAGAVIPSGSIAVALCVAVSLRVATDLRTVGLRMAVSLRCLLHGASG